jgi:hypothetical protein
MLLILHILKYECGALLLFKFTLLPLIFGLIRMIFAVESALVTAWRRLSNVHHGRAEHVLLWLLL